MAGKGYVELSIYLHFDLFLAKRAENANKVIPKILPYLAFLQGQRRLKRKAYRKLEGSECHSKKGQKH